MRAQYVPHVAKLAVRARTASVGVALRASQEMYAGYAWQPGRG